PAILVSKTGLSWTQNGPKSANFGHTYLFLDTGATDGPYRHLDSGAEGRREALRVTRRTRLGARGKAQRSEAVALQVSGGRPATEGHDRGLSGPELDEGPAAARRVQAGAGRRPFASSGEACREAGRTGRRERGQHTRRLRPVVACR